MSKFTVGQTVICIEPIDPRPNGEEYGGGGWELDRKFKIERIDNIGQGRVPIVWPGIYGAGVYEDFVRPIDNEWDTEENV